MSNYCLFFYNFEKVSKILKQEIKHNIFDLNNLTKEKTFHFKKQCTKIFHSHAHIFQNKNADCFV